jgi:hypothetical protein
MCVYIGLFPPVMSLCFYQQYELHERKVILDSASRSSFGWTILDAINIQLRLTMAALLRLFILLVHLFPFSIHSLQRLVQALN